jgi:hypothetical protein
MRDHHDRREGSPELGSERHERIGTPVWLWTIDKTPPPARPAAQNTSRAAEQDRPDVNGYRCDSEWKARII